MELEEDKRKMGGWRQVVPKKGHDRQRQDDDFELNIGSIFTWFVHMG